MNKSDEVENGEPGDIDERRKQLVERVKQQRAGLGDEGRRVVGERPRPRAIIWIEDEELRTAILEANLFPTVTVVEHPRQDVNDREWDVLVTDRAMGGPLFVGSWEPHQRMHVIFFARQVSSLHPLPIGQTQRHPHPDGSPQQDTGRPVWKGPVRAMKFVIPGGLSSDLERLVERDLLPKFQATNEAPYLSSEATAESQFQALLLTHVDELVIAAFLTRAGGHAEVLALPPAASLYQEWIVAAMRRWRASHPETFRHLPDWRSSFEWATAQERRVLRKLGELEREEQETIATIRQRRAELEDQLAGARSEGDSGLRRILSDVSDALVEATAVVLRQLGFEVEVRDDEAAPGRKLEDLRLRDPEDPEWVSLVEVRGYSGGASPKDLPRLSRFAIEFTAENQQPPTSLWYVVNQFAGKDPEARPTVLHNERASLDASADAHGLLAIDTGDLFRGFGYEREAGAVSGLR